MSGSADWRPGWPMRAGGGARISGGGWVSPDRMMTEVFRSSVATFYHATINLVTSPVPWTQPAAWTPRTPRFNAPKPQFVVTDCGAIWELLVCWNSDPLAGSSPPGWPTCHDGKPGNGRPHPPHQQAPGRLQLHRPNLQLGPAADSGGGRPERREELRVGELRREVVPLLFALTLIWLLFTCLWLYLIHFAPVAALLRQNCAELLRKSRQLSTEWRARCVGASPFLTFSGL